VGWLTQLIPLRLPGLNFVCHFDCGGQVSGNDEKILLPDYQQEYQPIPHEEDYRAKELLII
jgi:hypothetical protein